MTKITNSGKANILQRTEDFRMSDSDRRQAEESLHDGEHMGDLICRSRDKVRSAATLIGNLFRRRTG